MIAFVRGEVAEVTLSSAVLAVGGVGLELQCTPGTLATLRVGTEPNGVPGIRHVQGRMVMVDLDAARLAAVPSGHSFWSRSAGRRDERRVGVDGASPGDVRLFPR